MLHLRQALLSSRVVSLWAHLPERPQLPAWPPENGWHSWTSSRALPLLNVQLKGSTPAPHPFLPGPPRVLWDAHVPPGIPESLFGKSLSFLALSPLVCICMYVAYAGYLAFLWLEFGRSLLLTSCHSQKREKVHFKLRAVRGDSPEAVPGNGSFQQTSWKTSGPSVRCSSSSLTFRSSFA